MDKFFICGFFADGKNIYNGQSVKTHETYNLLKDKFGEEKVDYVDTYNWKKHPLRLLKTFFTGAKKADFIIMLPAHKGVKVFSSLLLIAKKIFKCKIFYDVIGGWLPEMTKKNIKLKKRLKKFDGIWVETKSMKEALEEQGFANIGIVPNFKNITSLKEDELIFNTEKPFKFCFFARVTKEKGVEDAVTAIKEINKKYGKNTAILDIYGPINSDYTEGFERLKETFDESIRYMGVVPPEKSVETLKNYFALLFPTKFYTEGIPGTIIDAYAAGVPVITSRWQSCFDIFEENVTGYSFEFGNYEDFLNIIDKIVTNPQKIIQIKTDCLKAAERYEANNIAETIFKYLTECGATTNEFIMEL